MLVVFFAVVAVIHQQQLFVPLIQWVLALPADQQPGMLFIANGLLSAISDNVFVASVYITEIKAALLKHRVLFLRHQNIAPMAAMASKAPREWVPMAAART